MLKIMRKNRALIRAPRPMAHCHRPALRLTPFGCRFYHSIETAAADLGRQAQFWAITVQLSDALLNTSGMVSANLRYWSVAGVKLKQYVSAFALGLGFVMATCAASAAACAPHSHPYKTDADGTVHCECDTGWSRSPTGCFQGAIVVPSQCIASCIATGAQCRNATPHTTFQNENCNVVEFKCRANCPPGS
jgi:hypothetical protein